MSNFLRLHVQLDILICSLIMICDRARIPYARKKKEEDEEEEEEEEERRKYNTGVINLLLECEKVPLF